MKKIFAMLMVVVLALTSTGAFAQEAILVVGGSNTAGMGEEISVGELGTITVDSMVIKDSIAELLSGNRNEYLVVHANFFNMSADTLLVSEVINAQLVYMGKVQYNAQFAADYSDLLFGAWTGPRYEDDQYWMTINVEGLDEEGAFTGRMSVNSEKWDWGSFDGLMEGVLDGLSGVATISLMKMVRENNRGYSEVRGKDGRLIINPITMTCIYENAESLFTYNLACMRDEGYNPLSVAPFEEIGVNFVFYIPDAIANAKSDRTLILTIGGIEYHVVLQ